MPADDLGQEGAVSALEGALGVQLFHRSPDGLVTTASGEALAAAAQRVEGEVLGVEGEIRGRDAQLRGPLRVSSFPALAHAFPALVSGFAGRYPRVALHLDLTGETASLFRQEADVATRLSSAPPGTLAGRRIGPVQFAVYASRALRDARPDAPLGDYPWIGRDGGPNHAWFESWLAAHAPGARVVLRMPYEPVQVLGLVRAAGAGTVAP